MDYKEKFEDFLDKMQGLLDNAKKQGHIIVRVEDLENAFPEPMESDDENKPNGGIVMEDFNDGNGFYKVNLAYLNEKQVEEIEELVKKWNPELKESEDELTWLTKYIEEEAYSLSMDIRDNEDRIKLKKLQKALAWLEKQGDKDKLIKELGEYKVKYIQEVLKKYINSMSNKDDERLRKTTIAFLKDFAEQGYENAVECIDWLEKQGKIDEDLIVKKFLINKGYPIDANGTFPTYEELYNIIREGLEEQGEQKPDNKVEPKFKVGDEIKTANEEPLTITKIDEKGYWSEDLFICGFGDAAKWELVGKSISKIDPKFHEGDWVVVSTIKGDRVVQIASVEYLKDGYPSYITTEGRWFGNGTKARLLTDKDVEIATIPESKIVVSKSKYWSEEDEHWRQKIIDFMKHPDLIKSTPTLAKHTIDWLESLKQRYFWKPNGKNEKLTDVNHEYFSELLENDDSKDINDYAYQVAYCISHDWLKETATWDDVEKACKLGAEWNKRHHKSAWSDEDKKMIGRIRSIVEKYAFSQSAVDVNGDLCEKEYIDADNWLKSLKDRVQPQPKQEWSEKDENIISEVIQNYESGFLPSVIERDRIVKALKSLKQKIGWKPSDEQMKAVKRASNGSRAIAGNDYLIMESLYNDLKKLKRE